MDRECRSCHGPRVSSVLSLGELPLANALLSEEDLGRPDERFPLELVVCEDCTLLQITESVSPEKLFREYLYFSSFSDTMLAHAKALAAELVAAEGLGPRSLVVEIASNDGYLLQFYRDGGVPVLGVEPALNVAQVARERGIRTVTEFFGTALAERLVAGGERANVVHSHNVLAHVPDLEGVVDGVRALLADDGVWLLETPSARDFVEHGEFDTIYHEHLCYFSLTALDALMDRHRLVIRDVVHVPIHAGSLRLFIVRKEHGVRGPRVLEMLAAEEAWGVRKRSTYAGFASRVESLKTTLVSLVDRLNAEGKTVAAYGAAAKATTLFNYFGMGHDKIAFAVDRSTYKQNRFIPGVRVPILPPSELVRRRPDYCLLTAWNMADEILAQQKAYTDLGGRFIVPFPEVRIVG